VAFRQKVHLPDHGISAPPNRRAIVDVVDVVPFTPRKLVARTTPWGRVMFMG